AAGVGIISRASAAAATLAPPSGILYTVDSTGDGDNVGPVTDCNDGSGKCTLRAAIEAANAHAGDDGIEFSLPSGSVINLTKALPDLSESVAINGPGADKLTVRRDTGGGYRIFTVATQGTVTFSGLTISNGANTPLDDIGGGI